MIDPSTGCCEMSQKCQPDLVVEVLRVLEPMIKANSSFVSTLYYGPDNENNILSPSYFLSQFPFFCSDREYIIGHRVWEVDETYYCVTKGLDVYARPTTSSRSTGTSRTFET